MARRLAIGSVQLSDRAPRIVAAGGEAELEALAAAGGADLVELRADLCEEPRPETLPALLARLRAGGRPVILTARAGAEGGRPMDEGRRRALYTSGLPHTDAIDVEIASTALAAELVPQARATDKTVVLSAHVLHSTPPAAALLGLVDRAEALGADVTKLVTHARDLGDLRVLLEVTLVARARGIVTLATGPAGPLRREQLLLRAPRAPPLLAADACPLGQSGLRHAAHARLELVEQVAAREEAVQRLRALALALDDHAGRPVAEHDTGGHLVDVLPALPARADEVLLQVLLAHAERPHARGEGVLLLGRDGEHARRLTIRSVGWPPPRGPRLWRRRLPHFLGGASGLSGCRACARNATPPPMQNARPSRFVLFAVIALVACTLPLASFPTTPPNDPLYPPDMCAPSQTCPCSGATCSGPTGQWNLLSTNDDVPAT